MSKEDNQVKWRGIRLAGGETFLPVDSFVCTGTQIAKDNTADNDTAIIHTVTADKIFYLNNVSLSCHGAANAIIHLGVRDDEDAHQYYLIAIQYKLGQPANTAFPFSVCLKIAAGWDIVVISDTANAIAHGFVHGHELDA